MITKADINRIKSLADKKGRLAEGLFMAEGIKMAEELLHSSFRCRELYVSGELAENNRAKLKQLFPPEILSRLDVVESVGSTDMARISQLKTPTEIMVLAEIPQYDLSAVNLHGRISLILDGIQDPGNMGTIIRLADWFGIGDIFCSAESADCFGPKAVQATMGSITRVRMHYAELIPFCKDARKEGLPIYGTFLCGENIYRKELSREGLVIMGNEGKGISPALEDICTGRLHIPSFSAGGKTESLNVALATAIVCSEFCRRRF